jgi:hypothetical protein
MNGYADDLAAVIEALDLRDATTGGGKSLVAMSSAMFLGMRRHAFASIK